MKLPGTAKAWMLRRGMKAAALLAVLGLGTGCTANGPSPMAAQGFGPTVTFESVDGPPPQVFDRLVRALETESASRNMSIVSRGAQASYRVRSYYAAQVSRSGSAIIAWVWDVYDRDQQRALRLHGEEATGKTGGDAWASANDQVLQRISQAGLRGLAGLTGGTAPPQAEPEPAPELAGPAMASIANDEPEAPAPSSAALAFNGH